VLTAETVTDLTSYPSLSVPYSLTVGNATAASGMSQSGTFGPALTGMVASTFVPLASKVTANTGTGANLGSEAIIRNVGTGAAGSTVQMQWRTRKSNEMPNTATSPPVPAGLLGMDSDVVDVTGITGTYVMQMTYNDAMFNASQAAKHSAFIGNGLYLASMNTTTGYFENAIARDTGLGISAVTAFEGTWDAFIGAGGPGNGKSIDSLLGSWGVDTSGNTAWAVINHTSEFAVTPEPGTLALLAVAGLLLPLPLWRSRRRRPT
jgi:hypothetical protein